MAQTVELKQVKVMAHDLKMGMFVSALDRPWTESPFLMQGFSVTSPKVLEKIREICEFVYIDSARSIQVDSEGKLSKPSIRFGRKDNPNDPVRASRKPLPINHDKYGSRPAMTANRVALARQSYQSVQKSIGSLFEGVQSSSSVDAKDIGKASSTLVSSAVRYPSALSWLALMQKHNDKVYNHALRASTWALLCGRHIGLEEVDLKWLTLGILMKDVGQLANQANFDESGLSGKSREEIAIAKSVALVKGSTQNEKVLAIIENYREKFNGTGKPRGLVGEEIPLLARIATIAIAYDLLLYPVRKDRPAMSPSEAASYIYSQRGRAFQDELAVQFIEAVGTYPMGTLVQLDSGEIGVVVDHDKKQRLKPKVLVVADEFGALLKNKRVVNLADKDTGNAERVSGVARDLSSTSLDLDMNKIQEEYHAIEEKAGRKRKGFLSKLLKR